MRYILKYWSFYIILLYNFFDNILDIYCDFPYWSKGLMIMMYQFGMLVSLEIEMS